MTAVELGKQLAVPLCIVGFAGGAPATLLCHVLERLSGAGSSTMLQDVLRAWLICAFSAVAVNALAARLMWWSPRAPSVWVIAACHVAAMASALLLSQARPILVRYATLHVHHVAPP